ncbi:MAG: hypothetical protein [phage Lak_Megaphage_RVC_AP4_GC26]|uniref:Uncharacterized protein n=1 Tax=phage Lak_Megaphage_RVC_AP3_GC26 TaxID=3109225 RepID=A0ABZ0Z2L0_9CAUD|nr:MAG: hypothetical protein [phage Lak_Megaphage_RVC_AP3_GC26]WQJ52403.1 MAG: hypothetical protein [phage Lak_Megaphage_RVC_AP4_GC26]
MKEKEVQTKELYPFVSDAIKKMDISLENIQWAHKIITNNTAGYLDDINKIQKYVEDIIDNACSVFREKITKELSLDDLLLYAQVAKTSQDFDNNKKRTSFFDKKIQDITIKDIDLINSTSTYKAIEQDLFGNSTKAPEIQKRYCTGRSIARKIKDTIKLYDNLNDVPCPTGKQAVYRLAVCIPKRFNKVNSYKRSLIYGRIPTMYFISDNRDRDFIIARNNYTKLIRKKYYDALREYEEKYVPIGHDISMKKISVL